MSLDVYLRVPRTTEPCEEREHYCKRCFENFTHEHMRDATETFYSANITHNLGGMAQAAGIYFALWRPAEMDPERRKAIKEQEEAGNYHGPGGSYELENAANPIYAREIAPVLRRGLAKLKADPAKFEKKTSPNGWGTYKHFVPFVEEYLRACEEHPDAIVEVSR